MKSTWKISLIIVLLVSFQCMAQRVPRENRFEVEADPIAFLLNGYSFHAGYTLGLKAVSIVPDIFNQKVKLG